MSRFDDILNPEEYRAALTAAQERVDRHLKPMRPDVAAAVETIARGGDPTPRAQANQNKKE